MLSHPQPDLGWMHQPAQLSFDSAMVPVQHAVKATVSSLCLWAGQLPIRLGTWLTMKCIAGNKLWEWASFGRYGTGGFDVRQQARHCYFCWPMHDPILASACLLNVT